MQTLIIGMDLTMQEKEKKKAMKKCKRCENFKPDQVDCIFKEIKECTAEDIQNCEYYLAKKEHVLF